MLCIEECYKIVLMYACALRLFVPSDRTPDILELVGDVPLEVVQQLML